MEASNVIYTLGTSNRSLDDFFSLLKTYGIGGIVDIRRFPGSRRFPHFDRASIEKESRRLNLFYCWLGDLLGGFRSGSYEFYKKEASYYRGLEKIEHLTNESLVVLVCAERLPWRCHRFKISQSLKQRGFDVIHIIDKDRTWRSKDTKG